MISEEAVQNIMSYRLPELHCISDWSHWPYPVCPGRVGDRNSLESDWMLFKLGRLVVFGILFIEVRVLFYKTIVLFPIFFSFFPSSSFFSILKVGSVEDWVPTLRPSRLYRYIHIINALSIDTWQCLLPLHLHTVQVTVTSDFSQLSRFWYPIKRVLTITRRHLHDFILHSGHPSARSHAEKASETPSFHWLECASSYFFFVSRHEDCSGWCKSLTPALVRLWITN